MQFLSLNNFLHINQFITADEDKQTAWNRLQTHYTVENSIVANFRWPFRRYSGAVWGDRVSKWYALASNISSCNRGKVQKVPLHHIILETQRSRLIMRRDRRENSFFYVKVRRTINAYIYIRNCHELRKVLLTWTLHQLGNGKRTEHWHRTTSFHLGRAIGSMVSYADNQGGLSALYDGPGGIDTSACVRGDYLSSLLKMF